MSGEALRREKLRLKIRQDEEGLREITRIRVSYTLTLTLTA